LHKPHKDTHPAGAKGGFGWPGARLLGKYRQLPIKGVPAESVTNHVESLKPQSSNVKEIHMQKKIIALAVAGLMSGAAFAQSNVTVSGVLDISYQNSKTSGASSQTAIGSGFMSGSRIGFKGTEDLGNGLKAIFVLEYGLAIDTNAGIGAPEVTAANTVATGTQARQQLLGLTGNWGTFVAGRAQTTGFDHAGKTMPGVAGSGLDSFNAAGASTLVNASSRANNAVAYISPSFSGLTVAYNHARLTEARAKNAAAVGGANDDNTANLLSADYANGPITAGLVWSNYAKDGTAANDDITEVGLRAGYNFGVASVGLAYQYQDDDAAATGNKDKKWGIGVAVPVGAGVIAANYAKASIDSTAAADDKKVWSVGYIHNLSKRTNAYAGYIKTNNETAADSRAFAVGLRHSF